MRRNSLLKRGFGWGVFLLLLVAAQAVSQTFKATAPLNPRSKDLQTVSPPTPAVKERKLPTKPHKATSDLSIERIYVRGCQVYITVANRGKAGLSLRDYNNGRLSLTLQWQTGTSAGLEPRVFTLKQVDPKGALGRPGGWVEFNTRVWVKYPNLTIKAKLEGLKDDRGKGKKELRQVLSVPERCWSKTSSGALGGAAVRSPTGKETHPQGKGMKGLPLTPLPGRASDLSIERVYLRDCKVQVVVKNRGSAGVTDEDYRNGKLRVKLHWKVPRGGGRTHTFALSQVDTHRVLRSPGMSVDFNTGITLGASEIYHVTAELVNLRHDLSQEGQKKLTQDLIFPQQCLSRPRKPGTRKPPTAGFPRPEKLEKPIQGKPWPKKTPAIKKDILTPEGIKKSAKSVKKLPKLSKGKTLLAKKARLKKTSLQTVSQKMQIQPRLYINNVNAPVIRMKGPGLNDFTPINVSWTVLGNVTATVLTISYIDVYGLESKLGEIVRDKGLPSNYSFRIRELFEHLKKTLNREPAPFEVYRFKFSLKYEKERGKTGLEKAAEVRYGTHPVARRVQRTEGAGSQEESSGMRMVTPSMPGLEGVARQMEEGTNPLQIKLVYQVEGDPETINPNPFEVDSTKPVYTAKIIWVDASGKLQGSLAPIEDLLEAHGIRPTPCCPTCGCSYEYDVWLSPEFEISSYTSIDSFDLLASLFSHAGTCSGMGTGYCIKDPNLSDFANFSDITLRKKGKTFDEYFRERFDLRPETYFIRGKIEVYRYGDFELLFTVINFPPVIYTAFAPDEEAGVDLTATNYTPPHSRLKVAGADCSDFPIARLRNFSEECTFTWGQQIPLEIVPPPSTPLRARIDIDRWEPQWRPYITVFAQTEGGIGEIKILEDTDYWKKFLDPGIYRLKCYWAGEYYPSPCGLAYVKVERGGEVSFTSGGKRRFELRILRAEAHKGHGVKLKIRVKEGNPITGEFIKSVPVLIGHDGKTVWKIDVPAPITSQWKEILLPHEADIPSSGQVRVTATIPESEYWYSASGNNYLFVPENKLSNYSIFSAGKESIGNVLRVEGTVKGDLRGSGDKKACPIIGVEFYTGQWENMVYEIHDTFCEYTSAVCNTVNYGPEETFTRCYHPSEFKIPFGFYIDKKKVLQASGGKSHLKMRVYVEENWWTIKERNEIDNDKLFDISFEE